PPARPGLRRVGGRPESGVIVKFHDGSFVHCPREATGVLPAPLGNVEKQRIGRGFTANLRPHFRTGRPTAATPETVQRRGGPRVPPPILVVSFAQERGEPRGEGASLELGEPAEPGIDAAQRES